MESTEVVFPTPPFKFMNASTRGEKTNPRASRMARTSEGPTCAACRSADSKPFEEFGAQSCSGGSASNRLKSINVIAGIPVIGTPIPISRSSGTAYGSGTRHISKTIYPEPRVANAYQRIEKL